MRLYYIFDNQQRKGPFTLDKLRSMQLQTSTPVWYDGLEDWTAASHIEELALKPSGSETIKLIIADDHVLYRAGVKNALSSRKDISVIGEAGNGLQLLTLLKSVEPDVILLDIQMPVMDGMKALPEIRNLYPGIKVIMLTMLEDQSMVVKLMGLGANSYLTKTSDADVIYQTIKTCHEQGFCFNSLTDKALLQNLLPRSATAVNHEIDKSFPWDTDELAKLARAPMNTHSNGTSVTGKTIASAPNNPLPKKWNQESSDLADAPRSRILSSFADAKELLPPKKNNRLLLTILIALLAAGLIFASYQYLSQSSHLIFRNFVRTDKAAALGH